MKVYALFLSLIIGLSFTACNSQKKAQQTAEAATKSSEAPTEIVFVEDAKEVEEMPATMTEKEMEKFKPKVPDTLFFHMARTPCFGKCPVYTLNIYSSGFATLEARRNFILEGTFKSRFTEAEMQALVASAKKNGYFGFSHLYDAPVTDLPSTTTMLNTENASNWVYNRMNSPEELRTFEQDCEALLKTKSWTSTAKSLIKD